MDLSELQILRLTLYVGPSHLQVLSLALYSEPSHLKVLRLTLFNGSTTAGSPCPLLHLKMAADPASERL
jgi:hypothetical protein